MTNKHEAAYSPMISVMFVLWNMVSSVGLILVNKWLLDAIHLECILLLASLHLLASWLATFVMLQRGVMEYKPMPFRDVVQLSVTFFVTVAFFNWSLMLNSVGTYQLMKLVVTPATAALQYVAHGKTISRPTMGALFLICCSVAFVSVSDVRLAFLGLACASIAVVASAFSSIWTNTKPTELGLSPYQVNYHIFPFTSLLFALASLCLESDPMGQLLALYAADVDPTVDGSYRCISMLLTCAMAASLNLSSSKLIHYTSPLTYHVVGHFKLILILTFGVLFLNSPINARVSFGMFGAIIGVVWYTSIRYRQQQQAAAAEAARVRQAER